MILEGKHMMNSSRFSSSGVLECFWSMNFKLAKELRGTFKRIAPKLYKLHNNRENVGFSACELPLDIYRFVQGVVK